MHERRAVNFSTHRLHKESLEEKLDKREDEDLMALQSPQLHNLELKQ